MYIDTITADDLAILRFEGSPSNANNALRTIKRIFVKAEEWGVIAKRPKVKLKRENGRELRLDDVAESKLLPYCSKNLRHAIIVMRDAGLRNESEVYALRWEYCFFEKLAIFNPSGKSKGSRRWVPMSDRIKAVLMERKPQNSGWVFPSKKNASGHLKSLAKSFARAREKAGLPAELKLYCARHDHGTVVTENLGLAAAKGALGHEDLKTTMRYVHQEGLAPIRDLMNQRPKIRLNGPSIN
jgi:integrase